MTTIVYFVRHAKSPYVLGEERERGPSEEGEMAAVVVAERLGKEGITAIYSSPYRRAIDTVTPLADKLGLKIAHLESLHERAIGSHRCKIEEGTLRDAIRQSFEDLDSCLEDGESTRAARDRALPTFLRLLDEHQGAKLAIGTHGNIMTIILHAFDPRYGYEFWTNTSMPDIYRATFDGHTLVNVDRLWS